MPHTEATVCLDYFGPQSYLLQDALSSSNRTWLIFMQILRPPRTRHNHARLYPFINITSVSKRPAPLHSSNAVCAFSGRHYCRRAPSLPPLPSHYRLLHFKDFGIKTGGWVVTFDAATVELEEEVPTYHRYEHGEWSHGLLHTLGA